VKLYPLKMRPVFQPRPWGGRLLKDLLDKDIPDGPVGESWEISPHPSGLSRVASGSLEGRNLQELARELGARLLGQAIHQKYGGAFPLLVKLIDVHHLASVQVHPGDEQAQRLEGFPFGKSEAWYILGVKPTAVFYIGFRDGVTEKDFLRALSERKVKDLLNPLSPREGDCILVPPGTVHACGGGVLLLEIQQCCDITYRVYDWDRTDERGERRPLHLEKARAVMDFAAKAEVHRASREPNAVNLILDSPFFSIHETPVDGAFRFPRDAVCRASTVIAGGGTLSWEEGALPLRTGDSFVVPAEVEGTTVAGSCSIITTVLK